MSLTHHVGIVRPCHGSPEVGGVTGRHFYPVSTPRYGARVTPPKNKLCGRPPQYVPAACQLTFDLGSGVRVTCDVGYLCANFSLPRPLCSRLRPDDRQTDIRRQTRIIA